METTSKVDNEILNTLQWTEDSYSLKDFVDVSSLPQVVKVIRGYDGGEHSASIRYGEVLTLHAIRESSIFQAEDTEIKRFVLYELKTQARCTLYITMISFLFPYFVLQRSSGKARYEVITPYLLFIFENFFVYI